MIKYIDSKKLLTTDQFVREPVDNLSKEVLNNTSNLIILNGGRGIGKSVILHNIENEKLGTDCPTIYIWFDSIINFSVMPNEVFNETFFEHYYEICFSWKLLRFIEKHYAIIYEKYFKDIELLIKKLSDEMDSNIRRAHHNGIVLSRYLYSTEISSEIVKRLKEYLGINSLNLAIDRFDWTNGRSAFSQQLLSRYFSLFNKTIVTSDDEALIEENGRKKFEEKGYSFVTANYGRNPDIIKQIIKNRIQLYNEENPNNYFDINIITDDIYQSLISKTEGNISSMIVSTSYAIDRWQWHSEKADISEVFDRAADEELGRKKQLRKISRPPKFHL